VRLLLTGCGAVAGVAGGKHCRAQPGLQLGQACLPTGVGTGLGRVSVHHDVQLTRQVVDDGQLFALQQQDVGRAHVIGWASGFQLFLDVTHRVVTKVARQAAAETRHTGFDGHLEALLVGRNEIQRVAVRGFHHAAIGHHLGLGGCAKTGGTQQRAGRQADEAVASKTLTAHHRLQQKAVGSGLCAWAGGRGVCQLQVQRQRGFEVGKGFDAQGNAVVTLGNQLVEFGLCDHGQDLFIRSDGGAYAGLALVRAACPAGAGQTPFLGRPIGKDGVWFV
jgi:hypothetical protein